MRGDRRQQGHSSWSAVHLSVHTVALVVAPGMPGIYGSSLYSKLVQIAIEIYGQRSGDDDGMTGGESRNRCVVLQPGSRAVAHHPSLSKPLTAAASRRPFFILSAI